jgi:uncharacterized membrane protein HdeD (DUF308 family)
MPRPDLSDPSQRTAYRRELAMVARPVRLAAVAFLIVSLVLLLVVPAQPTVAYAALAVGAILSVVGVVQRTRHHRRRMSE